MASATIGLRRLAQQRLTRNQFTSPQQVVAWLGAVQSQEYQPATWSLAMRRRDATAEMIEQAFTAGMILRTHVMRPTWHFVTPGDIRWLLELTAPRVKAANAYYSRQVNLDVATFARSNEVIASALAGGKHLTRAELAEALRNAGVDTSDRMRLQFLVFNAELDAVICSGPRRGKQFTYALLAERAPQAQTLPREEALAELTRRYFASHGPATARDFAWWSGLTLADVKAGLALAGTDLSQQEIEGQTYWSSPDALPAAEPTHEALLLPTYDEFLVGYEGFAAATVGGRPRDTPNRFSATVVLGGQVVGNWRRDFARGAAVIEVAPFAPLAAEQREAIFAAARRYSAFLGMPVECVGL